MSVWHRVKKVSSERHTQPRTGSASTTTMKHRLLCVARWTGGVYCARITLHGPDPPTPNLTSQHQAAPLAPADFVHAILREEPLNEGGFGAASDFRRHAHTAHPRHKKAGPLGGRAALTALAARSGHWTASRDAGSSSIAVLCTLAGAPWLDARCGGAAARGHKSSQGRGSSEPDVVATR